MSSSIVTAVHRTAPSATGKPRPFFLVALALAVASVQGVLLAAALLTLSLKATAVDADDATVVLSLVAGMGSVFSIVAYPGSPR